MKPIDDLFTEIAREHLGIATLDERHRDALNFHVVRAANVKDALEAAFDAGVEAAGTTTPKLLSALEGALYALDKNMDGFGPSKQQAIANARAAIAEALAARIPPADAAPVPPIVAVTVRGGLIEDMDATLPVLVVVEDWDITDDDTGKKPARDVWKLDASLSGPKAETLRRLIAND